MRWLESLDPARIQLGLARIGKVYRLLPALNRQKTRVVSVAGTNGKGTAVATLEALALADGKSVLAYFSPHIERVTERIRLNQAEVSNQQLLYSLQRVRKAQAEAGCELTYFEFLTLAALVIAADFSPDLLILEVGLGGRLDAVNLIDADLTILTSVGLDHQDWLGNSRSAIASEKLGICRPDIPLICGDPDPPAVVTDQSEQGGFPLFLIGRDFAPRDATNGIYDLPENMQVMVKGLEFLHPNSVASALVAARWLGLSIEPRIEPVEVSLSGRFERCRSPGREVILDIAHNEAAWESLVERLLSLGAKTDALVGVLQDKDSGALFRQLKPFVENWYLIEPASSRALSPQRLYEEAIANGIPDEQLHLPDQQALKRLLSDYSERRLLATGSFYTVALVKSLLREI